MKRLAVLSVTVIILTAFLPVVNAEGCTRMFWNTNGKVMLVGRNMDLNIDHKPIFYVFPKGISKNEGVDVNSAEWTSLDGSKVTNHYGLEDASSDAAIIEFVGGRMNACHGSKFTTLTNDPPLPQMPDLLRYGYFGGSVPLPGDLDSASRFVRASAFLLDLSFRFDQQESLFQPLPGQE